jgi:hypothetical protein
MTVSSNGGEDGTGIVWATTAALDASSAAVPGTLRAFNANDIKQELYGSDENSSRDAMGTFVKMTTPVVSNGKVYVNTQSNELPVYGLLCQANAAPGVSFSSGAIQPVTGTNRSKQQVTLLNNGADAVGGPFSLVLSGLPANVSLSGMSGKTSCIAPAGSIYIELSKAPLWLKPGKSFTAQLTFTVKGSGAIAYTPMVVAGSGGH